MAAALNISTACLVALNTTVDCDPDLFRMAGNADGYFWSDGNATDLCTSQCLSSASSWWGSSASACEFDQLNAYGRVYPAETVPGRYLDGLNIVCLTASTDVTKDVGINGTLISYTGVGGANSSVNSTEWGGPDDVPDTGFGKRDASASSSFCLVQSYDWVGSDIIRPDCDDPANVNQSQCIDPTDVPPENSRIANLYPDSLLCSDCFLKMFYLRLASPYLPDLDDSDFMIEQWYDILEVCNANASMPELIIRSLPYYDTAPGISMTGADNATTGWTPSLTLDANGTCAGRELTIADMAAPPFDFDTQTPCDVLPPALNASTGDVILAMGSQSCEPVFNITTIPSICLPLSCHVGLLPSYTTCDQYAQSISTANSTITATQLQTWNPNFIGLCSNTTQQFICVGAPGGTYIPPYVANSTTSAAGQQRGGGNGNGTPTGSGGVDGGVSRNSTYIQPGQPAPSPIQSGVAPSCTRFAEAQAGDGCTSFADNFDLTLQALTTWNPVLGVDGANCATALEAGVYYCIGVQGTTTTSPPTSTTTAVATPSPVQSGIVSNCNKFALANSGEYCSEFAPEHGITTDQLYAWNTILGVNGANCGTAFQAGVYYCVGIQGTVTTSPPTTTTSPSVSTPSPVQTGIVSNCNKFALANSGEYCSEFAPEHGITTDQLYAWNTILGANGANCGTAFQAGVYYCIGVSASTPTTTAGPTSTASVPSPVQSGIDPQCTSYAKANSGEYCSEFAPEHGISTGQLYLWNPVLGANGANCGTAFQAGVYYCVGAPPPSPVQSGIDPQCTNYAKANSGEYCSEFAPEHGITTSQLYSWNPVLGSNGANCGTAFQANVYYCVGAPN